MATVTDSGDWRSKCKSVQERWCEAWKRNLHTDVEFLVGKGDVAKGYHAHKNVLAFSSPVFEAMFFEELPEKSKAIPIPDIEPEAFDLLLRYSYGENVKFPSIPSAAKTYLVADKYLVPGLQKAAESHITQVALDDNQFWELMHDDSLFSILVIHKKCLEYLAKNGSTLFKSHLLSSISKNVMETILSMDKMKVSEYELLLALVRWAHGKCVNRASVGNKLQPLLCHIRFSNLTVDEFCKFKDDHPSLIDDTDSLAIMKHIYKRSDYRLPKWCSGIDKRRDI